MLIFCKNEIKIDKRSELQLIQVMFVQGLLTDLPEGAVKAHNPRMLAANDALLTSKVPCTQNDISFCLRLRRICHIAFERWCCCRSKDTSVHQICFNDQDSFQNTFRQHFGSDRVDVA